MQTIQILHTIPTVHFKSFSSLLVLARPLIKNQSMKLPSKQRRSANPFSVI